MRNSLPSFSISIPINGVLLVKNSVSGKSSVFNKYPNGVHFDSQKQDDAAFEDGKNFLDKTNPESLINSLKRSADDVNSRWNNIRKRSPYGLVYNQGKPIGILEPIPQSFEYNTYPRDASYRNSLYKSQWFPVKRESDFDLDELEQDQLESQSAPLHSNNYANVLAKFKVNNKVKHRPYQDYLNSQVKRAAVPTQSRRKEMEDLKKRGALDMGDLKADMKTKMQSNLAEDSRSKEATSKVDEIEQNLKDVMDDMGLVEKDKDAQATREGQPNVQKREIYFEDEDLENGLNKIGFTKESRGDRNKKEDCPGKTKVAKSKGSKKFSLDKSLHKKGKKKVRKDEDAAKRSVRMSRKRVSEKKDAGAAIEPKMKR
ncbi:hypothetical protein QE152_g15455 [Popillia japonica]|uniref:Uncharacterized protein n=1 Tax=Popillia japonica TaxID=7064 RepID=A0AAW1L902_POPJA